MPRETTESRQNSSRYGSSALLSGTVGCTSQSMAPTSVITSVMSLGFDVGGLGDFLPARDLFGHPGRQFRGRVAIDIDAEIFRSLAEFIGGDHCADIGGQFFKNGRRRAARRGDRIERNHFDA